MRRRDFTITAVFAFIAACRTRSGKKNAATNVPGAESVDPTSPPPSTSVTQPKKSVFKDRATKDYVDSLSAYGGKLAKNASSAAESYDVVIVGSGYGASVVAARLGERFAKTKTICVLERGVEWLPGTFPDEGAAALREVGATGLYDLRRFTKHDVIVAQGLGGGSLINANIAARAGKDILTSSAWPSEFQSNPDILDSYYQRAEATLGIRPFGRKKTSKSKIIEAASSKLGTTFKNLNLAVTMDLPAEDNGTIINGQGMRQRECNFCGDCMSGCNMGAKNTLNYNYLPLAKNSGVEIYTSAAVQSIEKVAGGFNIHYNVKIEIPRSFWSVFRGPNFSKKTIFAKKVVLGAGTLGSTEILLRSAESGLKLSSQVGTGFSGNGNVFGLARSVKEKSLDEDHDIGGKGAYAEMNTNPGPNIQVLSFKDRSVEAKNLRFSIEDLGIPRALVDTFNAITSSTKRALFYFSIFDDGAGGKIFIDPVSGKLDVNWPEHREEPAIKAAEAEIKSYSDVLNADQSLLNEVYWFADRSLTAHPLGGCRMADSAEDGVVNSIGQVFSGTTGNEVHEGLYIADGSILPSALGINPFLTITALAERISESII